MRIRTSTFKKFWSNIIKTGNCWIWKGDKNYSNYGIIFVIKNRWIKAHRYSYQIHFGKIPDKMNICHHCDNPSCVRPDHLFLGTQKDNLRDAGRKGRVWTKEQQAKAGQAAGRLRKGKCWSDKRRKVFEIRKTLIKESGNQ